MKTTWGILVFTAWAASAAAQTVEMDPLQCWWRTTAPAVRVGEPFSLVLTCSVVENDAIKVVPDQSPLDPTAMQMPPFEVIGGSHRADIHADDHRFFQYDYTLRVIGEDVFGKDVKLPDFKITYRVQSRVNNSTVEGIEKTYFLPAQSIRVLSTVPADATDIRDSGPGTFGDIEARTFRANVLTTVATVLFGLAALMALVALVTFARRYRRPSATTGGVLPDSAILRGVGADLASIARGHRDAGWTPVLAGRLLTDLRILAGYGLGRPASQTVALPGHMPHDGEIIMRGGWSRGKKALVSGSATPRDVTTGLALASQRPVDGTPHARLLQELEPALTALTAGQYGRAAASEDALDHALSVGAGVARRLRIEQTWPVRKYRTLRRAGSELGQRVWSH